MKLRIKGNSLRLRVTRPELDRLADSGRVEESIHFAADERSKLIYALERSPDAAELTVTFNLSTIALVLPAGVVDRWRASGEAGIYATVDLGPEGALEVSIEKDFACLHGDDSGSADSFPNPDASACS
ncbi:MAG: DUF7009 family protein [Terracidiphilus sp.]